MISNAMLVGVTTATAPGSPLDEALIMDAHTQLSSSAASLTSAVFTTAFAGDGDGDGDGHADMNTMMNMKMISRMMSLIMCMRSVIVSVSQVISVELKLFREEALPCTMPLSSSDEASSSSSHRLTGIQLVVQQNAQKMSSTMASKHPVADCLALVTNDRQRDGRSHVMLFHLTVSATDTFSDVSQHDVAVCSHHDDYHYMF